MVALCEIGANAAIPMYGPTRLSIAMLRYLPECVYGRARLVLKYPSAALAVELLAKV